MSEQDYQYLTTGEPDSLKETGFIKVRRPGPGKVEITGWTAWESLDFWFERLGTLLERAKGKTG